VHGVLANLPDVRRAPRMRTGLPGRATFGARYDGT
jgi:hypothetical protein